MKTFFTLLLFLSISLNLQAQAPSLRIGLFAGIQHDQSLYTLNNGQIREDIENQLPLGHTIGLQIEKKGKGNWAFQSGLSYSRVNFYPRLQLPFVYGTQFIVKNEEVTLFSPFLQHHQFDLVSILLKVRYYLPAGQKLKPFVALGVTNNISLKEKEIYQGNGSAFEGLRTVSETQKGLRYFGFGFDVAIGLEWQVANNWSLLLHHNIRAWEYRTANEKFKQNGELLFEKQLLSWSQIQLELGIMRSF